MNLIRATIVALNALRAVGATVANMLMGKGHENRCPHLDDDQSNYGDLLSDVHGHVFNVKSGRAKHKQTHLLHFKRRTGILIFSDDQT